MTQVAKKCSLWFMGENKKKIGQHSGQCKPLAIPFPTNP